MNNNNSEINDQKISSLTVPRVGGLPTIPARSADFAVPGALSHTIAPTMLSTAAPLPDVLSLLVALRRRYKLVLGAGPILAALIAAGTWYLMPTSKYTARAMLQVASSQPKMIFKTEENRVDFQIYQRTQLTLLKSRNLLNKALNDSRVSKLEVVRNQVDPVLWLEKKIQADYLGEVLRISMSGDKPADLSSLVNAVTDSYRKEVVDVESKERWLRHDELKKIYDEYQVKLKQRRDEMKTLAQRVGSKDKQTIRYSQELAMERMATARRELIQTQSELRRAKAELEIRTAQGRGGVPGTVSVPQSAIQRLVEDDAQVKQHRERIARLKAEFDRVDRIARDPSDPALHSKRKDLDASKKTLAARVAELRPLALERLKGGLAGDDSGVEGLRNRVEVMEELTRVTQSIYDVEAAENREISQDTLYIDAIQDEIGHADNAAKRIGEELEALSVELKAPSRVRQLETADTPRQEEDKRVAMAGMAGCGTFGLFALGIALLEFRSRRISSIDEVTQILGLRVVGALPPTSDLDLRSRRGTDARGGGPLTESIDSIRTMLLHSTGDRSLNSIMVTSATSGEGKTSLACHLATSLARSGLKTLLIDCDLRKPTIHRLFDIPATPGFAEFLRGESGAGEVIRTTAIEGPDVITAGVCDARALRALARADAGSIFDGFRASYDIIVVDTSPILPVTDALLVGRHVDAAVYSVLRHVSRLPLTVAAVDRLKLMNIRVLGAVVTGVRSQTYGPYYSEYVGGGHHA